MVGLIRKAAPAGRGVGLVILLSGTVELLALWQRPRAGKIVFIVLGELFD